jgi:hypothetical protein
MTKPTGKPRGRPKGSTNKRTIGRELTAHRLEHNLERNAVGLRALSVRRAKLMPLDVMENNLAWACNDAAIELQAIFDKSKAEGDAKTQLAVFLELRKLRAISQCFARDAAPYRHAKLHAVSVAEKPEPSMRLLDPFQDRLAEVIKRFGPKPHEWPLETATSHKNGSTQRPANLMDQNPPQDTSRSIQVPGALEKPGSEGATPALPKDGS